MRMKAWVVGTIFGLCPYTLTQIRYRPVALGSIRTAQHVSLVLDSGL